MFVCSRWDDAVSLEFVCCDHARENAIYIDVVLGPHAGEVVGQTDDACFCRGVVQLAWVTFAPSGG